MFRRFDYVTFWICWLLSVCQCTAEELSSNRTGTGGEESVLGDEIIETREGASETVSRRKENCSDGGINQNQVRSRLHDLELELSSVLQLLKSNTGESESQKVVPKLCPWWTQICLKIDFMNPSLFILFLYIRNKWNSMWNSAYTCLLLVSKSWINISWYRAWSLSGFYLCLIW